MKVGDHAVCADCKNPGVIVCTNWKDYDQALVATAIPLEPSEHGPGITCHGCEVSRFKAALPARGVCAYCGRPNPRAIKNDLGTSRSFCNDQCISGYTNERSGRTIGDQTEAN